MSRYTHELAARNSELTRLLGDAECRTSAAASQLEVLGYKEVTRTKNDGWEDYDDYSWAPTAASFERSRIAAQKQAAQVERDITAAREDARREALEAVIDGLELIEYDNRGVYYFGASTASPPALDTERFWADITTALDVRAQKRQRSEQKHVEARVSALAKGGKK